MIKKDGANTESVKKKIATVSPSTLRPPGAPERREGRLKMEPAVGGPVRASLLGTPGSLEAAQHCRGQCQLQEQPQGASPICEAVCS